MSTFTDDGARIIQQGIVVEQEDHIRNLRASPLMDLFQIDRTVQFIYDGNFKRVALQFPDAFLNDSAEVLWTLQEKLLRMNRMPLLFVSGDTSFGSCCVDEVSAQHFEADSIVHYGRACLSPYSSTIPVLFIFINKPIDSTHCADSIKNLDLSVDSKSFLVVLYDVSYAHAIPHLSKLLDENLRQKILFGSIEYNSNRLLYESNDFSNTESASSNSDYIVIAGLRVKNLSESLLNKCSILYIGSEGRQLTNILMRCSACVDRWSYDPSRTNHELREENVGINKDLMRRFHQVQKVREAGTIGIVAAGIGLLGSINILSQLKRWIESTGRKSYTFSVGRVNPTKLANFQNIEAFCLVACSECSILDSREFNIPIVTPLELQIALGLRNWGEFYSTDLTDLSRIGPELAVSASREDPDAPFFSTVSGKYIQPIGEKDFGNRVLSKFVSPAADFLVKREYQGLERNVGCDEAHEAVPGSFGIASSLNGI